MSLLFKSALMLLSTATAENPDRPAWEPDVLVTINEVKQSGREGRNGRNAADAARRLAGQPPDAIPEILGALKDADPLAANLLRGAVESIVDRARSTAQALPIGRLEAFVRDTGQAPRARRFAYELIVASDPSSETRLVGEFVADPSPELRRDAVAHYLTQAEELKAAGKRDEARAAYERALSGAIHDDQVRSIVEALKEYGVEVDLKKHFGFVTEWKVVGPFDNRGMKGFAAVYPPEEKVDFAARYQGQRGEVSWKPIVTEDPWGVVDIAKQIENYKGSAMYLASEFDAADARPVEVRIGTPNAWKLWVNGELLFAREEYHRGEELDQYRVPAKLEAGRNVILLKILQNEQSDDWAQSYKFRLRVTDPGGQAVSPVTASTGD